MTAHNNPHNIRRGISLLGLAALLVGVLTASVLYWSFGTSLTERVVYALVGVIFATAGGLLLPAAVALWQAERPGAAAGVLLFWLSAILPLGLSGHAGFFSLAQSELAAQSLPAQVERARLDAIEARLESTVGAAGVDAASLQAQAEALRQSLRTARDERASCPPGFKKNCIDPAEAKIAAIQAELQPIESQLSAHAGYLALQSQRADTVAALAQASSGATGDGGYHPLFSTLARLLGVEAGRLQAVFLAWSAVALELIAALSFIIAGALAAPVATFTAPAHMQPAGVVRPAEMDGAIIPPGHVPALDTGAFVTADGYAYLHSGERVLNSAETAEYHVWLAQRENVTGNRKRETVSPTGKRNGKPLERETVIKTVGAVRPCSHCGEPFTATRKDRKYCGDKCRALAWEARTGATLKLKS